MEKRSLKTTPSPWPKLKKCWKNAPKFIEPTYEQNLALDHVTKFAKLDSETSDKLVGELQEIIKKTQAVKLTNIMPEDMADMRLMFAKERGSHKKEELEQLLNIINQYREQP